MTRTARVVLDDIDGYFGPVADGVRTYLHDRGVRVTPARIAVVAALSDGTAPRHASAQSLLREVETTRVHLDETTLYRTLTKLEELALIHRVAVPDRSTLYGLNEPPHHHAICTRCRSLQAVPVAVLAPMVDAAGRAIGYQLAPTSGSITFQGLCGSCSDAQGVSPQCETPAR